MLNKNKETQTHNPQAGRPPKRIKNLVTISIRA